MRNRNKGVCVILSDLFDKAGFEDGLRYLLAGRYDVFVVQVVSPQELDPGLKGDLKLIDLEDGDAAEVSITAPLIRQYSANLDGVLPISSRLRHPSRRVVPAGDDGHAVRRAGSYPPPTPRPAAMTLSRSPTQATAVGLCAIGLVMLLGCRWFFGADLYFSDQPKTVSYTADVVLHGRLALPRDVLHQPATKPPLYNWIGATAALVTGSWSPFVLKLPSVIGAIGTTAAIVLARPTVPRRLGTRGPGGRALAQQPDGRRPRVPSPARHAPGDVPDPRLG